MPGAREAPQEIPPTRLTATALKGLVYTLLVINCFVYAWQDWQSTGSTPSAGRSPLDWIDTFPTALDDFAWLVLLLIYEVETAWLSARGYRGAVKRVVMGVCMLCYAIIGNTIYVYAMDVHAVHQARPAAGLSSLCQIAGQGQNFLYNQYYTAIDDHNCSEMAADDGFIRLDPTTVTDARGLVTAMVQSWVSLVEAVCWLLLIIFIAVMTRLQERGVAGGPVIRGCNALSACCYVCIFGIAFYWAGMRHYLYLWDDMLWVGGFAAVDANLLSWRRDMLSRRA